MLTREEKKTIESGAYLRYTGESNDLFVCDEICLFVKERSRGGEPTYEIYVHGARNYGGSRMVSQTDFDKNFVIVEDEFLVSREITALMGQAVAAKNRIQEMNAEIKLLADASGDTSLPNFSSDDRQRLLGDGNVTGKTQGEDGAGTDEDPSAAADDITPEIQALQPTARTLIDLAREFGSTVAGKRDALNAKKEEINLIKKRIDGLRALEKERQDLLLRFSDYGEKLEKIIKSLNLYLGTGEEIIQIKHGEWASPGTKLAIRQLIMGMDSESKLLTETGGIDFKSIQQFDAWLVSHPAHIQQIIPEEKGIVCLKPRLRPKSYGEDKGLNDLANARNAQSYILIRHGENLFRIASSWAVGKTLFPTKEEFNNYFYTEVYDSSVGAKVRKPIKPGSNEWDSAMRRFTESNSEYRNTLLMIQGIIDRTGIFPDLQERGVNLLNFHQNQSEIIYVNDADPNYLLHTGRETFFEYQKRLNSQLEVGHRVIISNLYGLRSDNDNRFYPKNARVPDLDEVYELHAGSGCDFCIRYDRDEKIWVNDYYRGWIQKSPERKASLKLYKDDTFILAYDLATADDMKYFMDDRLSRIDYLDIIPLFKKIYALKRVEEAEEENFLMMLVGYMMKKEPDREESELRREARSLINFWKFKTRRHRPIKEDIEKAFRMIRKEYENSLIEGYREAVNVSEDKWRELVTAETLYICQKGALIQRFERADRHDIYLTQTDFKLEKGELKRSRRRESFVLRRKLLGVKELYTTEAWAEWTRGYDVKNDFMRESEAGDYLRMLDAGCFDKDIEYLKKRIVENAKGSWDRFDRKVYGLIPIGVFMRRDDIGIAYYFQHREDSETCKVEKNLVEIYWTWERKGGRVRFGKTYRSTDRGRSNAREYLSEQVPAEPTSRWHGGRNEMCWLRIYRENFAEIIRLEMQAARANKRLSSIWSICDSRVNDLIDAINKKIEADAKKAYVDSFGDERNWQYYRQNAGIVFPAVKNFDALKHQLAEFIKTPAGGRKLLQKKTVTEIAALLEAMNLDNRAPDYFKALLPEEVVTLGFGDWVIFPRIESSEPDPPGEE